MSDPLIKSIYYDEQEITINLICHTKLVTSLGELCKRLHGKLEQHYLIDQTYDNTIVSFSTPYFAEKFHTLCQDFNSKGFIFFNYSKEVLIICRKELQDKCFEYLGISSFDHSDLMDTKKTNDIVSFFIISPKSYLPFKTLANL